MPAASRPPTASFSPSPPASSSRHAVAGPPVSELSARDPKQEAGRPAGANKRQRAGVRRCSDARPRRPRRPAAAVTRVTGRGARAHVPRTSWPVAGGPTTPDRCDAVAARVAAVVPMIDDGCAAAAAARSQKAAWCETTTGRPTEAAGRGTGARRARDAAAVTPACSSRLAASGQETRQGGEKRNGSPSTFARRPARLFGSSRRGAPCLCATNVCLPALPSAPSPRALLPSSAGPSAAPLRPRTCPPAQPCASRAHPAAALLCCPVPSSARRSSAPSARPASGLDHTTLSIPHLVRSGKSSSVGRG